VKVKYVLFVKNDPRLRLKTMSRSVLREMELRSSNASTIFDMFLSQPMIKSFMKILCANHDFENKTFESSRKATDDDNNKILSNERSQSCFKDENFSI